MQRFLFVVSLLVVGGCYAEEPGIAVGYGGSVGYAAPSMEYVGPGVQVVSDYDYPVFYSDGFYWRYDGGVWYRSGYWNRGWGVSYNVPIGVRGIARPEGYAHYRGSYYRGNGYNGGYNGGGYARPNAAGGVYVNGGNRGYQPAYRPAPAYRAPSRPVVRDHRR